MLAGVPYGMVSVSCSGVLSSEVTNGNTWLHKGHTASNLQDENDGGENTDVFTT